MTTEEEVDFERTILLVGDNGCGKTSLVNAFISDVFTEHYTHSKPCSHPNFNSTSSRSGYQTIVEPKSLEEGRQVKIGLVENEQRGIHRVFQVGGKTIDFTLRDTNGEEDEEIFGALVHEAHVVFVCFAMDDPPSLENARCKWATRIEDSGASARIVLVGCKIDTRTDTKTIENLKLRDTRPVSKEEAVAVAWKMKPQTLFYTECSAKNSEGISDVLNSAAKVSVPGLRVRTWRGRWLDLWDRCSVWLNKWGYIIVEIYSALVIFLFLRRMYNQYGGSWIG